MLRTESEHDCYGAGHAGTALSAALGMAVARDMAGGKEHIIAVAGDAAFTNGISFEALNNIAAQTKRLIVVLNDNEWSIDNNVGAIAEYLHKIVTNPHYISLHDRAAGLVEKFGGKTARHIARKAEEAAKGMRRPSMIFEEFGLNYYGPIDGHNLPLLIETFKFLKQHDRPVLLHVLTQKGRGFQPALDKQKKFHGLGPYDPETGETKPAGQPTYSEVFAETLAKLANKDDKVVAITAAMPNGTGARSLPPAPSQALLRRRHRRGARRALRRRHGHQGLPPLLRHLLHLPAARLRSRRARRRLQKLPVVFCMDRAGLSGDDGPTHHGLFDISYLRGIPNIVHMAPKDEDELADMMYTALQHNGPSAIRYPRGVGPGTPVKEDAASPRDRQSRSARRRLRCRHLLARPHAARSANASPQCCATEGHSAAVINPRFVKPIDRECIARYAKRCSLLVTFEDHVLMGGFGSAVLEASTRWESKPPSSASAGPTSSSSTARSKPSAPSTASPPKPPSNASAPTSATLSRSKPTANPTSTAVASLCVFPSRPLRQKKGLTGAPELRASVRLKRLPRLDQRLQPRKYARPSIRGRDHTSHHPPPTDHASQPSSSPRSPA